MTVRDIYRRTSNYVAQLIRSLSRNQDILLSEEMYSSSFSSELSSASAMSISSNSRSTTASSTSSKCQENTKNSYQPKLKNLHRRSTSLIERKQAQTVKTVQIFDDDTGYVNVIADNFPQLNHASTTYLDNCSPTDDITNTRFPVSKSTSALQLPSEGSTPNNSGSSSTSRTYSHCSCFSCSIQGKLHILNLPQCGVIKIPFNGYYIASQLKYNYILYIEDHISVGKDPSSLRRGSIIPTRQRRPSQLIFDFQVRDFYDVLDVLGEGSFSTVYLAESIIERGGYAAIKVIQKGDLMKTKKIPVVHGNRYMLLQRYQSVIGMIILFQYI